jgi:hypothetical protein
MRRLPIDEILTPEDLQTARRFRRRIAMVYCCIALGLLAEILIRGAAVSPQPDVAAAVAPAVAATATIAPSTVDSRSSRAPVAISPGSSFSPLCAAIDLQLVTSIEAHGEAEDVANEQLAKATFTLLEARRVCREGRVTDAVALYDRIDLRPSRSARTN